MNVGESQGVAAAIGLPVVPVLEVRERFSVASVLIQALLVGWGLFICSVISMPAAAFLGVAIALRLAWMVTHRRRLVWDGHDVWLVTGRSRKHAARRGAGEIRQLAVRRLGAKDTRRYYVIVNAAGEASVPLPISQWDAAELAALASAAGLSLTDYGLISASDAAILVLSPTDKTAVVAFGVCAVAVAIAWFTQR